MTERKKKKTKRKKQIPHPAEGAGIRDDRLDDGAR
jgi:hypothetical protein